MGEILNEYCNRGFGRQFPVKGPDLPGKRRYGYCDQWRNSMVVKPSCLLRMVTKYLLRTFGRFRGNRTPMQVVGYGDCEEEKKQYEAYREHLPKQARPSVTARTLPVVP